MIHAAIITVSDRSFRGERPDLSGPALAEALPSEYYLVTTQRIVPDEREQIAALLRKLADEGTADVIFTTGGTGVAPRDVTPEATRDVIDREFPGFGELMRTHGRKLTKFAPLSRALAGNRGTVLIINFPGSPRGAVDSLSVILELVPHVLRQLKGIADHE